MSKVTYSECLLHGTYVGTFVTGEYAMALAILLTPNHTFLLAPFHDTSRNNNTINARLNVSDNVDKVKVNTTHPK